MPLYQYACRRCGSFEDWRPMSEAERPSPCPACGKPAAPEIAHRLHELAHAGRVEYIVLGGEDVRRHRLHVRTDRGTECAVTIGRAEHLADGAVLLLEADRAIVVRLTEARYLALV